MAGPERRNLQRRAAIVKRILDDVARNPGVVMTLTGIRESLALPVEAVERIMASLVSAGLVSEIQPGVWKRV